MTLFCIEGAVVIASVICNKRRAFTLPGMNLAGLQSEELGDSQHEVITQQVPILLLHRVF